MAITKRTEIASRAVLTDGSIEVRTDTVIEEDGVILSRSIHRHVVHPGDNVSGEHPLVQRTAEVEHTAEVVAAYRAARE